MNEINGESVLVHQALLSTPWQVPDTLNSDVSNAERTISRAKFFGSLARI